MPRPLLAALALALATVFGPVAGVVAVVAVPAGPSEEGRSEGWGPRTTGWLEPGPRGRVQVSGDTPRALPRRALRLPLRRSRVPRPAAAVDDTQRTRPELALLGRRQTDGG
jgi:hypothetical protein